MIFDGCGGENPCYARHFNLLRNAPLSSIYIHFGVALLVLTPLLTSVSLSKNKFFDRLKNAAPEGAAFFMYKAED